jgi:FAD/FMN-containing dehydrogenase/Fe-S oxidoreductase
MKPPFGNYDDSELTRAIYSRAACIYKKIPTGVLFPGSTEDFIRALDYSKGEGIPITPRGGGSGLAGQSVGSGMIIDHSRYMNKIELTGGDEAVVEMGVVLSQLNRALSVNGMIFPPDPSSQDFCTIGGMIANNSKGPRSVKYGSTLEWLNWVEILLSDGTIVKIENKPLMPDEYPHRRLIRAAKIIDNNRTKILAKWPRAKANTSGYNLKDCLCGDGKINLLPLFAGSEGTLGIFLRASLRLRSNPKYKSLAIAEFASLGEAAKATLEVIPNNPSACELLDKSFIDIVRKGDGGFPVPVSDKCGSLLILEADGESKEEAEESLNKILRGVSNSKDFHVAKDSLEKERIWSFRKAASPLLNRGRGKLKSIRFIEDGSVPTENIPAYVEGVSAILESEGIEVVMFGHSGDGNFHVNPFMDLTDKRHFDLIQKIAGQVAFLISSLGGALAGEHGDGRLRTPYLRVVYGDIVDTFIQIKKELDPQNIFNPGIIAAENPSPITEGFRFTPKYERTPLKGALSNEKWAMEIERCHGCGTCRDFCPTAKATNYDPLSSRGRAHFLQAIMDGTLNENILSSSKGLDVFDSCISCSECLLHCPTGVDISPLSALVLGSYSTSLKKIKNTFYTSFSSMPYKAPKIIMDMAGILMGSTLVRSANEKLLGFRSDIELSLPKEGFAFDPQKLYSFKGSGKKRALLFYGCFGNIYNKEGETLLAVKILEKLGVEVIVPPQACCGVSKLSRGLFDLAVDDIVFTQKNFLRYLDDDNTKIVYTSPSCAMAVIKDHPAFFPSDNADKLASRSVYISEFLYSLLQDRGIELDPLAASFAYQTPCHASVIGADEKDINLLRLIPAINFRGKTNSCCGLGGTYGIQKKNSEISDSLKGELKKELESLKADYIVTPCGSCKIQVSNMTAQKIVHPLELIAISLGINKR